MPNVRLSSRLEVPEWPPPRSTVPPKVLNPSTSRAELSKSAPPMVKKQPQIRLTNTALHQAVLDERIKQVRLLVNKHGARINSVDIFGRTPLMLTCMLNNEKIAFKMMKMFVDGGATFNNKDVMGRTILSYACMKGKSDFVKRILREEFYEINEPDNDGCTPLHHAAVQGSVEIIAQLVDKLLQYDLDIDKKDKLGYTAFLLACKHGWYRSAMILLEEGYASPCVRDNEYFYNAVQWINASRPPCIDPQAQYLSQRSKTSSAFENTALSFSRDTGKSAIYIRHRMPIACKHKRRDPDPFSSTDIDLPEITPENTDLILAEELSVKQELLYTIEELFPSEKERPMTSAYSRTKPSTAKLLALRPDRGNPNAGSDNIGQLLKLYANNYAELRVPRSLHSRPFTVSLGEKPFRH